MLRGLFRTLAPRPARALTITNRLFWKTQGTVKSQEDQHHLQDRHFTLSYLLRD
jgi:hypothetical protein